MARRLEELVEAWQQLFPLYFVSPKDLQLRLSEVEKTPGRGNSRFANRGE